MNIALSGSTPWRFSFTPSPYSPVVIAPGAVWPHNPTMQLWSALLLLLLSPLRPEALKTPSSDRLADNLTLARQYLEEARQLCQRDQGRLWGKPFCQPVMLVDRKTRFVVTSEVDNQGQLRNEAGVFVGQLPLDINIWNTSQTWAGKRWAQVMWPVPKDPSARREVLVHEQFHLVQAELGIQSKNPQNPQLDQLDGRYLMQLELRALRRALSATDYPEQVEAMQDALLFRKCRWQEFPSAEDEETSLELVEGTAAYTGVKLGIQGETAAAIYAVKEIDRELRVQTFTRSFAYATGPAYGLLLDRHVSNWRELAMRGYNPSEVLQLRLHWKAPADLNSEIEKRAGSYDGKALRASDEAREIARHELFNKYRGLLVDGPVLWLPNAHMNVQKDPENVLQYDGIGTVTPRLRVVADWGILEVSKAALIDSANRGIVLPAPFKTSGLMVRGDGWALKLKEGWEVAPGQRSGDFRLSKKLRQ